MLARGTDCADSLEVRIVLTLDVRIVLTLWRYGLW